VTSLDLRDPFISVTGFNRPTLTLSVIRCRGDRAKTRSAAQAARDRAQRALVYVGTVAAAEEVATELDAACYHGRQDAAVRRRVQEDFTGGRSRVVVATSRFRDGSGHPGT